MGASLKNRQHDDHSYLSSPEYIQYRDTYVEYIKAHAKLWTVYVNMDIINNAAATWDNQMWMEAQGLTPLPVWHCGTGEEWLVKYLEAGYTYIAFGGLIPNHSRTLVPILDRIWQTYLIDKNGMPKVKVHGFAIASVDLVSRYPWYSCDSSSCVKAAGYGKIYIPPQSDNGWDWTGRPRLYHVSDTGREQGKAIGETKMLRKAIADLVREHGFEFGKSKGKGKDVEVLVPGVRNDYAVRYFWNVYYLSKFVDTLPEWPWAFKPLRRGLAI
jgi:hypothetical protein